MEKNKKIKLAAEQVGRNSYQMKSFVKYQLKEWRFFFAKNSKLNGSVSRPPPFKTWAEYDKLNTGQKMALLDIANIKAPKDNPSRKAQDGYLNKLILAGKKWPKGHFAVFQSGKAETNTCNIFVGETLYEAGVPNILLKGKYFSASTIYNNHADMTIKRISNSDMKPGDIAAWDASHVAIIVKVDKDGHFTTREGYRLEAMGQERTSNRTNIKDPGLRVFRIK